MGKKIKHCIFDCLPELVSGSTHSDSHSPNAKKQKAQDESLDPQASHKATPGRLGSESGMTHWIDISWPVSPEMTTYKNRGGVSFTPIKTFAADNARETMITIPSHNGTHVDAPAHFIHTGSTVDKLPFSILVGPCLVLDLSHVQTCITKQDLEAYPISERSIILLKTRNSLRAPTDVFDPDFVYLSQDGAQFLVEKNVTTVGIDGLGIEHGQPEHQTHLQLLAHGVIIIEGLRLAQAHHGTYFLCCLPLLLEGLDGAPARAILCEYVD